MMVNLIIKDIYQLKKTILLYMLVGLVFIASFSMSDIGMSAASSFIFVMVYATIIRNEYNEDKNRAYAFLRTLPIKPYKIVVSKYITALIITITAVVYSCTAQLLSIHYFQPGSINYAKSILPASISAACAALLFSGVFFILVFKLGSVKAINYSRLVFLLLFFGIMALSRIFSRISNAIDLRAVVANMPEINGPALVMIVVVIYLCLMLLGINVFSNNPEALM